MQYKRENTIVFGLRYDSGMNFHSLYSAGVELSQNEQNLLLCEMRRCYRDWIHLSESDSIKLDTSIRGLNKKHLFFPLVIPSGNERFKHIYLVSKGCSGVMNACRADQIAYERENKRSRIETDLCSVIGGVVTGDATATKETEKHLLNFVTNQPEFLKLIMLLGAAVLQVYGAKNCEATGNSRLAIVEEIAASAARRETKHWRWPFGIRRK